MIADEMKVLIHYYARDDDGPIPSRKSDIQTRAKHIYQRIPYSLKQYLETKNVDRVDIEKLDDYGDRNEFTADISQKIAQEQKASELVRVRKLLT